jgi:carboxymethylenebutenolidase
MLTPRTLLTLLAALPVTVACGTTDDARATDAGRATADAAGTRDAAEEPPTAGWTGALSEEEFKALHELSDRETPPELGTWIDLDGVRAYLSLPPGASAPVPGVIVIHEWWGLNQHIVHWTDRLAAEGYAALAVDLYLGQVARDRDQAMALVSAVDRDVALDTLQRAHRFLVEDERVRAPRTGSIGWCFGGGWSLELALAQPELDACVIYYGKLVTDPERLARLQAELFGVFGTRDGSIPPDSVADFAEALKTADKPHTVRNFEADHAFANPSSQRYDEDAAAAAWAEVRAFLAQTLEPLR